jgi:rhamnose transport system permease protein
MSERRERFSLKPLMRWETLRFFLLIASLIWGAERSPYFWEGSNFKVATSTFMERAIMALPMTLIIISGEIDLSVASILGLTSAVMGKAWMNDWPLWACILLALAVGATCGLFNGLLVTWMRLPSLVVTLGTLALFRGLAYVVLGSNAVSDYPQKFNDFGFSTITGTSIPWSALIFVSLLAIFLVLLHRSRAGRQIYAVGLNQEAARYSAVRVARLKLWLFVLSGTIASVAGILFTARVSSSRADNAVGFELDVIAAVLLGGVSIFGGKGTVVGVALSLAVVATIRNALGITNVGPELQSIVIGGLLILSVLGPNLVARLTHAGRRSIVGLRGLSPGPSAGD